MGSVALAQNGKIIYQKSIGYTDVATGKNTFTYTKAGIEIEFNPEENSMILKQSGGEFKFAKE